MSWSQFIFESYSQTQFWNQSSNISCHLTKVRYITFHQFNSVQSLSSVWLLATPWTAAQQASLSINELLEFTQTHVHWVGDAIQPSHPLSSPFPPAFNLFHHQGLFKWVSSLHQVAKVFSFNISPSNEHPGLISFSMD